MKIMKMKGGNFLAVDGIIALVKNDVLVLWPRNYLQYAYFILLYCLY